MVGLTLSHVRQVLKVIVVFLILLQVFHHKLSDQRSQRGRFFTWENHFGQIFAHFYPQTFFSFRSARQRQYPLNSVGALVKHARSLSLTHSLPHSLPHSLFHQSLPAQ